MPTTAIRIQQTSEELVSEEVKEIISYRPHWMIRKGNLIFFAVVNLLLLLTVFIESPYLVHGSARLVAVNAPKLALAHKEGKLVGIAVPANSQVLKGQHLAYLESTADYKEVVQLYQWLQSALVQTSKPSTGSLTALPLPTLHNLGELQTAYQNAEREWQEQKQFFGNGYYQKKRVALQQDLTFTARLKDNIYEQTKLHQQEQVLIQNEFAAYDSLAKDRLVAPVELNKYKSELLGKEHTLIQTSGQLINSDVAAHNKKKEILDLQKAAADQQQKFLSSLLDLKSITEAWIQQYVVTAPVEGTLYSITPLQLSEQISNGQELFYVQPSATSYYAQIMAGQNGLGKVKEGQTVRLKADSYPSDEYGYLKGIIRSVAAFPNRRDSFLVLVDLPKGLITEYGKRLFFRNNLSARAEVITDDRTLFDRIFDQLKKLWKE